jgi:hypothetical protein
MPSIPFNDSKFTHLPIAPSATHPTEISSDGHKLTIKTDKGDWWRTLDIHSYNAPVFGVSIPEKGDWEVSVDIDVFPETQVSCISLKSHDSHWLRTTRQ